MDEDVQNDVLRRQKREGERQRRRDQGAQIGDRERSGISRLPGR